MMLLITMREWFGAQVRKMPADERGRWPDEVRIRGFITRLPLGAALARIRAYEDAYKTHYRLAVEFELLSVVTIDDLSDDEIALSRAVHVEALKQRPEDFQ